MWTKNCVNFLAFLVACGAYEVPETVRALGWHTLDFQQLPTPADLAFRLSEDEFEDYLDFWLQKKTELTLKNTIIQEDVDSRDRILPAVSITNGAVKDHNYSLKACCSVTVASLSEPQPVYVSGGALLAPSGNSGNIAFSDGQVVTMACPSSTLSHSSTSSKPVEANLVCTGGTSFSASCWLSGTVGFATVGCTAHSKPTEARGASCVDGGTIITVGLTAAGKVHTVITSCFHESKAEVFYVEYDQNPNNAVYMSGVARPSFSQGAFYPGLSVDTLYTQVSQQAAFDMILGSGAANKYLNTTYFLARGHLAAKTDYVFSPAQRATFTFVNVAPQWQPFNGGNWNTLEQKLRLRIGAANARTKVYTGTWGILQLKDNCGTPRNLYLSPSGSKIPVPLWYYKVVHEACTGKATAFLGLNNPHVTLAEARALAFCTDRCAGNSAFSWLNWQNTNVGMGFSICCDIADFRRTVTRLPAFTANGGLFS